MPDDTDHVAEQDVDLARRRRLADHLDAPGAVDDVQEDELSHVATGHRPTRDSTGRVSGLTCLERLALVPDRRDLVPIGEALRWSGIGHRGIVRGNLTDASPATAAWRQAEASSPPVRLRRSP